MYAYIKQQLLQLSLGNSYNQNSQFRYVSSNTSGIYRSKRILIRGPSSIG